MKLSLTEEVSEAGEGSMVREGTMALRLMVR